MSCADLCPLRFMLWLKVSLDKFNLEFSLGLSLCFGGSRHSAVRMVLMAQLRRLSLSDCPGALNHFAQVTAINQLHRKEMNAILLAYVQDWNDMQDDSTASGALASLMKRCRYTVRVLERSAVLLTATRRFQTHFGRSNKTVPMATLANFALQHDSFPNVSGN